jgi:hypothetical protein
VRIRNCTAVMKPGKPAVPAMMDGIGPMEAAGLYLRFCEEIDVQGLAVAGCEGETINWDQTVRFLKTEERQ